MVLPLWLAALPPQVDLTMTASPSASVIYGSLGTTHFTMGLATAEAAMWMRVLRPRSTFIFDTSGHYGQALFVTGTMNPPRDLSGRTRLRLDIATSPRTNFLFFADGFISSRIGMRASDELAVRDPFSTNRVLDGWSAQSSFSSHLKPLSTLRFDLLYSQMGAVSADVPAAVGIDTHAVWLTATALFQMARRFSLGPMTRLGFTHFNHALLDLDLHRGSADVFSAAALGTARYDFGPRTRGSLTAGFSITSAPPGNQNRQAVFSPDLRIDMRSLGRRIGLLGAFSFGYQSVGPRIGFGMNYAANLELWARPFRGGDYRNVLVNVEGRTRWANTQLPDSILNSNAGTLRTNASALGISVTNPVRLGWSLRAGADFEFVSTHMDPEPPRGDGPPSFRLLFTLGLVAATSSDRDRLLPVDPLQPPQDDRTVGPIRAVRRKHSAGAVEDADDTDEENDD